MLKKISQRFADEDVWLTQEQLATIYNTTQQNISQHVLNIYEDNELDEIPTHKKFLLVRLEGKRNVKRNIDHYNLDMIISLGYRVQSDVAVRFRRWATQRLPPSSTKLFALFVSSVVKIKKHQLLGALDCSIYTKQTT